MEFLEQFPYVIKYKKGKSNVVVDALSRRHTLFSKLGAQIDEGLTPTKDGGTCLRRLSMFRKEVH